MHSENMTKIALNAAKRPKFETLNRKLWLTRTIVVTDLPSHWRLTWFCACKDKYVSLTHGHTLFWGITQFILIVHPYKLLSE